MSKEKKLDVPVIKKQFWNRKRVLIILFTILILGFASFYGVKSMLLKNDDFVVNYVDIKTPNWVGMKPLRMVLIGDLHVSPGEKSLAKLRRIVSDANALDPDLTLLLGDYMNGRIKHQSAPYEIIADELSKLHAKLGVYAVMGNHEVWHGQEKIIAAFEKHNIPTLENKYITLKFHGEEFNLVGVSDYRSNRRVIWEKFMPPKSDKRPIVMFTHNPDIFPQLDRPIAVLSAGHTHGGQVRLPKIGPLLIPSQYGRKYDYGVKEEEGNQMYITSGAGSSVFALRYNCPQEIVLMTLSAESKDSGRTNK